MAKTRKKQKKTFNRNELLRYYLTPNDDGTLRTYRDVSEHFGINERQVEKIGSSEEWVKQREEYGKMVNNQLKEDLAELASQVNKDLLNVWFVTLGILRKKAIKYNSVESKTEGKKVADRAMKDFTDALKNTTDKIRVLTNQPSDVSKTDSTTRNITTEVPIEKISEIDQFLGVSYSEEAEETPEAVNPQ